MLLQWERAILLFSYLALTQRQKSPVLGSRRVQSSLHTWLAPALLLLDGKCEIHGDFLHPWNVVARSRAAMGMGNNVKWPGRHSGVALSFRSLCVGDRGD